MARISSTIDEPEVQSPDLKPPEPAPGAPPSKIGFFQSLRDYTEAQWEGLLAYVYRLLPITDRLATGNQVKYVMKYGGPFDEDQLKNDLGSGRYRIQLNQIDAKGKSKTIKTIEVEIEDPNFPPKVPPGEWLDDPRNKRWAWAKKKVEPEAPAASPDTWSPERVMNMVERLRPQERKEDQVSITREVLNAVKETRAELGQANNPSAMMGMLKELILLAKPEGSAGKSDDGGMVQVVGLLTRMLDASEKRSEQYAKDAAAERQRHHELELKRMEQQNQKGGQGDMLEVVDRVLGIKERLMEDAEPRRRVDWKEELVHQGLGYIPQLIELGKTALSYRVDPRAVQQQQQQPQQQPQPTGATLPQQTPQQQPQQQIDPDIERVLPFLANYGQAIVGIFRNNPNGHALADQLILATSEATYDGIALMGPAKLLAAVKMIPQMHTDLLTVSAGNEALLQQFLAEFCEGPEEDEDPPSPPEVVKPARGKKGATA